MMNNKGNALFLILIAVALFAAPANAGGKYPKIDRARAVKNLSPEVLEELRMWENVIPLIQVCPKAEIANSTSSVAKSNCITEILTKEMLPFIVYPELFISLRETAKENSLAYDQGKIDSAEYERIADMNWLAYLDSLTGGKI